MARKKEKALEPAGEPANQIDAVLYKGETKERALARVVIHPENKAATIVAGVGKSIFGETSVRETAQLLREQIEQVQAGDMKAADAMLVAQAASLDTLIAWLVQRAMANATAGYLQASLGYMQLAFKAQSNARATWETVSKIHNPPPNFIRQANIANGPQQVNNGPRAEESANQPNELMGGANVVDP